MSRELDAQVAEKVSGHEWGWIGTWGIIVGVHRCAKCGQFATEENVRDIICLAALQSLGEAGK